jgi:hypothetical protein
VVKFDFLMANCDLLLVKFGLQYSKVTPDKGGLLLMSVVRLIASGNEDALSKWGEATLTVA